MESKKAPAQLVEEFKERAGWYCKGFGLLLQSLHNNLEIHSMTDQGGRNRNIRLCLEWMEELYACVEESKLRDNPDAPLLLSIKNEIATVRRVIERILFGQARAYGEAYNSIWRMSRWGEIYRNRLTALRDEIRKNDGWEKFTLRTTDVFDKFEESAL